MWWLIKFIILGPQPKLCRHFWKTVRENQIVGVSGNPIGNRYLQRCENCGELRTVDLSLTK